MTPELYRAAIAEQKKRYDTLAEVACEMRDILEGLLYWYGKGESIDKSWWDAAWQVVQSDYLETQPGIVNALRGLYTTAKMVLEESQTMADTKEPAYLVSLANMLALEGAVGDVERLRTALLVEGPDDHDRR